MCFCSSYRACPGSVCAESPLLRLHLRCCWCAGFTRAVYQYQTGGRVHNCLLITKSSKYLHSPRLPVRLLENHHNAISGCCWCWSNCELGGGRPSDVVSGRSCGKAVEGRSSRGGRRRGYWGREYERRGCDESDRVACEQSMAKRYAVGLGEVAVYTLCDVARWVWWSLEYKTLLSRSLKCHGSTTASLISSFPVRSCHEFLPCTMNC